MEQMRSAARSNPETLDFVQDYFSRMRITSLYNIVDINTPVSMANASKCRGFGTWTKLYEAMSEDPRIMPIMETWVAATEPVRAKEKLKEVITKGLVYTLSYMNNVGARKGIGILGIRIKSGTVETELVQELQEWENIGLVKDMKQRPMLTKTAVHKAGMYKVLKPGELIRHLGGSQRTSEQLETREASVYIYYTNMVDNWAIHHSKHAVIAADFAATIPHATEFTNAITALTERRIEEYVAIFRACMENAIKVTYEREKQRTLETIKEIDFEEAQAMSMMQQLESKKAEKDRMWAEVTRRIQQIATLEKELFYMRQGPKTNILKDAIEFMESCQALVGCTLIEDNNYLILTAYGALNNFDADNIATMIDTTRSNLLHECPAWEQALIKEIFIDRTIKQYFKSTAKIALNYKETGENVLSYAEHITPIFNEEYVALKEGMPNPHHKRFNCWGTYQQEVEQCMEANDYTTAVAMSVAAITQLNTSDMTVLKYYLSWLRSDYAHLRMLELPDKRMISPREYQENWEAKQREATRTAALEREATHPDADVIEPIPVAQPQPEAVVTGNHTHAHNVEHTDAVPTLDEVVEAIEELL